MSESVVLGIDLGGTNTKVGLINREGKVLAETFLETVHYKQFDEFVAAIAQLYFQKWKGDHDFDLCGIGMGAPNGNKETGEIISPPNLPWGSVNVEKHFQQSFKSPLFLVNDANAMALTEKHFGQAKGVKNFIVLTLGTGLGSGLFVEGNLLLGGNGMAGEAGHMVIEPKGRKCACSGEGHLESYVSARGIVQTAKELGCSVDSVSALQALAKSGDNQARLAFEKTGEYLGRALAQLHTLLAPELFIITGGISRAWPMMERAAKSTLEELVFAPFKGQAKVVLSDLNPTEGAILGAAALAWENL